MYNRVTAEYEISSDKNALEQVTNPHFTFHVPHWFHLKNNKQKARKDEQLFAGICPVDIVVSEQGNMPWVRAISRPIRDYKSAGLNWSKVPTNDIPFRVASEDVSIQMEVNFIPLSAVGSGDHRSTWTYEADKLGVEFSVSITDPKIPTLSWFHQF